MLKKIWTLLAWRNWGILRYNSFWQNIVALFYIALTDQLFNLTFLNQVGSFILFSTIMTGYGYLINDLADVELDMRHGKPNVFLRMSKIKAVLIVLGFLVIGSLFALPFLNRPGFLLIWLLWILAATFYSMPPLRLKVRGLIGLMATIAAQQILPTALIFAAFGELVSWAALVFVLYSTARGVSSDVGHQMRDWSQDASTDTGTFAVHHGYNTIKTTYAISLEFERMAFGGVMIVLLLNLPRVIIPLLNWQVSPAWLPGLAYAWLFFQTFGCSWRAQRQGRLQLQDPYKPERQQKVHDTLQIIHHSLPSVVMPLYLACWMTMLYWPNSVFVLVLVLLYKLYSPQRWMAMWPLRPMLAWLRTIKR